MARFASLASYLRRSLSSWFAIIMVEPFIVHLKQPHNGWCNGRVMCTYIRIQTLENASINLALRVADAWQKLVCGDECHHKRRLSKQATGWANPTRTAVNLGGMAALRHIDPNQGSGSFYVKPQTLRVSFHPLTLVLGAALAPDFPIWRPFQRAYSKEEKRDQEVGRCLPRSSRSR